MSLVLTREEIADLTRCKFKAGQVSFFIKNGIRHYVDAHGWPVVTRAAVEGEPDQAQADASWKPNKAA
ncbi:hypothetical protein RHOFW510R12_01300 [Rhodanobacter sp. FW510-R12]|uniref:DUF4224 domain-containing protein n=1 Tax=unclassified Rhodanobacter TaxID=2621553 RepID=UPI0007A9FFB8|nr:MULTISPECIES: DUF4224 domain-containing protein [unclassified Rhodanobacter]KZC17059.1 hypothetical protein RHOFW104R8_13545 [Rhodanobacter sp. FW104-R8]KZC28583.1 hypothetical protein RhoFW510T8_10785 [Rhodanobacter sp. FW510-T8]KZC32315.1 hypothetical protein RhoFW510R10_12845 [Rhodanobacter sp. FW510-R10]